MTKDRRSVLGNIALAGDTMAPSEKRPVGVVRAMASALDELTRTPGPGVIQRAEHRPQDPRVRYPRDRELALQGMAIPVGDTTTGMNLERRE